MEDVIAAQPVAIQKILNPTRQLDLLHMECELAEMERYLQLGEEAVWQAKKKRLFNQDNFGNATVTSLYKGADGNISEIPSVDLQIASEVSKQDTEFLAKIRGYSTGWEGYLESVIIEDEYLDVYIFELEGNTLIIALKTEGGKTILKLIVRDGDGDGHQSVFKGSFQILCWLLYDNVEIRELIFALDAVPGIAGVYSKLGLTANPLDKLIAASARYAEVFNILELIYARQATGEEQEQELERVKHKFEVSGNALRTLSNALEDWDEELRDGVKALDIIRAVNNVQAGGTPESLIRQISTNVVPAAHAHTRNTEVLEQMIKISTESYDFLSERHQRIIVRAELPNATMATELVTGSENPYKRLRYDVYEMNKGALLKSWTILWLLGNCDDLHLDKEDIGFVESYACVLIQMMDNLFSAVTTPGISDMNSDWLTKYPVLGCEIGGRGGRGGRRKSKKRKRSKRKGGRRRKRSKRKSRRKSKKKTKRKKKN